MIEANHKALLEGTEIKEYTVWKTADDVDVEEPASEED